jgi:hypothetical protein
VRVGLGQTARFARRWQYASVESHHGRLSAKTNDGPGASFSFSTPCASRVEADTKLKWTVATREAQSVRRREAAKTSWVSRSRARLLRFWLPTRRSLPTERSHRFDCYQNIDRYHRAIHSPDRGWSDRFRGLRASASIATGLPRRLSRSEQQLP